MQKELEFEKNNMKEFKAQMGQLTEQLRKDKQEQAQLYDGIQNDISQKHEFEILELKNEN